MTRINVANRTIEIANSDKLFFPDAGITKGDLADYYARIAEVMLPHVQERPVTMQRYPDGMEGSGFYQKEQPDYFPDWIETVTVSKQNGEVTQVVCNDAATLVYLADQGCITPHVWLSTVDDLDHPDRMVFDLDPPEGSTDPEPVRSAARATREVLDEDGLGARLMTTGSAGYHVVVPLDRSNSFDTTRDYAHVVADELAHRHPDRLTAEQRIEARTGRVFIDYLRNGYAQTTVAAYAVRARPAAPVATPIEWDELGGVDPRTYTVANVFRRLGQKADPWSKDGVAPQSLPRW